MSQRGVVVPGARFRWDAEREVLVYDGTNDPDPHWRWNEEKQGYDPVEHDGMIWDRRAAMWVQTPKRLM